jgi:cysteinyl-tRNA synthetase
LEQKADNSNSVEGLMKLIIELRQEARNNKDWGTADKIRDGLAAAGITVKDGKDGVSWEVGDR